MLRATTLALALVLAFAAVAVGDEGQGPGDTSNSTVDQVNLGTYWYGAKIAKEDLKGKVVLFEIWGS